MDSDRYNYVGILPFWHRRCMLMERSYPVYRVYKHHRRAAMASTKTSQKGLKDGWIRATFILREDYLEKLKASAYWQRKQIKEVIDEALRLYLKGKKTRTRISR
ncbi:MAG: hypothetical protein ABSB22_04335 [Thermodesulfobacteriota bacterium]